MLAALFLPAQCLRQLEDVTRVCCQQLLRLGVQQAEATVGNHDQASQAPAGGRDASFAGWR